MSKTDDLNERIAAAIAESDIPKEHNRAFLLVVTAAGLRGVIAFKVRGHWQADSMFPTSYDGEMQGGILVKGSWQGDGI